MQTNAAPIPTQASPVALNIGLPALVGVCEAVVVAGFPSPAEDLGGKRIDLNDILVKHPASCFTMRVSGHSMRDAGIDDGDIVIVDRAVRPQHGHMVIAVVDGDFTVKRLSNRAGRIKLQAANPTFPDIVPTDSQTIEIWGVVTHAIKSYVRTKRD